MNRFRLVMFRTANVDPNAGLWNTCFGPKRSSNGYINVLLPVFDGPTRKGTRHVFDGPFVITERSDAARRCGDNTGAICWKI